MITQLSLQDKIFANKLKSLGFFYYSGLERSNPPKHGFIIKDWYFSEGLTGVWAYRDGLVFFSNKTALTESLKLQIFELFKSAVDEERAA